MDLPKIRVGKYIKVDDKFAGTMYYRVNRIENNKTVYFGFANQTIDIDDITEVKDLEDGDHVYYIDKGEVKEGIVNGDLVGWYVSILSTEDGSPIDVVKRAEIKSVEI